MPESLEAVLIANEVLDAVPVHLVHTRARAIDEIGVSASLEYAPRPATGELLAAAAALDLPDDYRTEINLASRALVSSLGERVTRGALLFIDYGFPAAEYHHPQRSRGTLMCHYRHRAHDDPFVLPGLQDITAHVDFTSVADAALDSGMRVLGFTPQAQFLINCGITDVLAETPASDARAYAPLAAQAQKLMSPAEMGELFKAIAFGRGIEGPLLGFARGDRTHTL
jgi:SAM-dependent MidA family methyltransferase